MSDPTIDITYLGGNCPVQAEGFVNGAPFYFRARHEHWSFGVGSDPVDGDGFYVRQRYVDGQGDAGWMSEEEARAVIEVAAKMYATLNPRTGGQG